jgi:uncharacterized membrane protein (DUF106 family)
MNFMYDSFNSPTYKQFLMPYIMYQRRQDIDGGQARNLFNPITVLEERRRLVFIICIIIGGILLSAGLSLLILTCFRNRQRVKLLRELEEESQKRNKLIREGYRAQKREERNKRKLITNLNESQSEDGDTLQYTDKEPSKYIEKPENNA